MYLARATLFFVVATVAAIFCAQSVEAATGPRITSKVYFDIKHGDQVLGRSAFISLSCCLSTRLNDLCILLQSLWAFLVAYVV
jgi:hypothetical protein